MHKIIYYSSENATFAELINQINKHLCILWENNKGFDFAIQLITQTKHIELMDKTCNYMNRRYLFRFSQHKNLLFSNIH